MARKKIVVPFESEYAPVSCVGGGFPDLPPTPGPLGLTLVPVNRNRKKCPGCGLEQNYPDDFREGNTGDARVKCNTCREAKPYHRRRGAGAEEDVTEVPETEEAATEEPIAETGEDMA